MVNKPLLIFLRSSMLNDNNGELIPKGGILDCSALIRGKKKSLITTKQKSSQNGENSAHYAVSSSQRQVISMDPSPKLVQQRKDAWGSLQNLEIGQGSLGQKVGTKKSHDDKTTKFPVYTIDPMYFDKKEKLAFAHLDLERSEYDAFKGGVKIIRANKPVLTIELRVHETKKTTQLLDLINSLGYDRYVIDEPCGWQHIDMRNILCIPRNKSVAFGRSNGFGMLLMMEGLKRVTSGDIAQVILPCCALGGECCPGDDINGENCSTEELVSEWYDKNKGAHGIPPAMLARKEFLTQQWRLRQRQKVQ